MKSKMRVLALVLALILAVCALGACGSSQGGSEALASSEAAASSGSSQTAPAASSEAAAPAQSTEESGREHVTLKVFCYEWQSSENDAVAAAINDALPDWIDIEWQVCPSTEGWGAQERLLAADPSIHVFRLGASRFNQFLSQEYLADLTDYVTAPDFAEKYPYLAKRTDGLWDSAKATDGRIYALPADVEVGNWYGFSIRADWLEECGLEMPKTIEDMDNILKAFKERDPSKYTLIQYPDGIGSLAECILGAYNGTANAWYINDEGKLDYYLSKPGTKDYVAKVREWYELGYLNPEFVTYDTAEIVQDMTAENAGVVAAWCTNYIQPNISLREGDPNKRFEWVVMPLEGPAGAHVYSAAPVYSWFGCNINSTPDEIEAFLTVVDFFSSKEGDYLASLGIEGVNYTIDGDTIQTSEEHAYSRQFTTLCWDAEYLADKMTGTEYIDRQRIDNGEAMFMNPERQKCNVFDADCGLLYDYSTGENLYSDSNTAASTYISEFVYNMIVGNISLDEWDKYVQGAYDIGVAQMVKERNEQWAKYGSPGMWSPEG